MITETMPRNDMSTAVTMPRDIVTTAAAPAIDLNNRRLVAGGDWTRHRRGTRRRDLDSAGKHRGNCSDEKCDTHRYSPSTTMYVPTRRIQNNARVGDPVSSKVETDLKFDTP